MPIKVHVVGYYATRENSFTEDQTPECGLEVIHSTHLDHHYHKWPLEYEIKQGRFYRRGGLVFRLSDCEAIDPDLILILATFTQVDA